ncbi:MAG: prepilin-type cleavage/methylation domain-containing protein [Deltaproteobacteria bacterium]|nr:MAG: prepilin-type cleavage/methylation domain-containing protein [Deltaproteobacteria bacterium]
MNDVNETGQNGNAERSFTDLGGFTLIELVIVMGIVAVIATFAYPNFKNWLPNYRLKAAARDLYSKMQLIRLKAVKENKSWAVVFDVNNNKYHLCSEAGADGLWSTLIDDKVVETVDLTTYKSGVSFGHGNATTNATTSGGIFPMDNVSFTNGSSDPNVAVFTSKGLCVGSGYCYLSNSANTAYAVGAQTSGVIVLKKWTGSKWE